MRLNIADSAGREAAARYRIPLVPAILVFDKDGRERYRTVGQLPRPSRIIQAVEASLAGGEKRYKE